MKEKRTFRMNQKLLYDVITRQAGSIEKAWLEIVQNAIDAGAKKVEFEISPEKFEARDDGKGMSKEDILKYFEEFGNSSKSSHDLGEFGMGRGQIFAQGETRWYTRDNRMEIDVKKHGLDYSLTVGNSQTEGTHIFVDNYKKIRFLDKRIERFAEWIKFVEIDVIVNGKKINETLDGFKTSGFGFIKLTDDDSIKTYNRGIFVKEDKIGSGAVIVSNKNMRVNFARNDVMDDCPVFESLISHAEDLMAKRLKEKVNLSSDDRKTILNLIRESEKFVDDFKDKKVIPTANNNFMSIQEVRESPQVFFTDGKNQHIDDQLIEGGYTVLKNIPIIRGILNQVIPAIHEKVGNYAQLKDSFEFVFEKSVSEDELSPEDMERFNWLKALNQSLRNVTARKLTLAKNMAATAHTNGRTGITIDAKYVSAAMFNKGFLKWILLHEYSHDDNTEKTDEHGYEFYERFYDISKNNREESR